MLIVVGRGRVKCKPSWPGIWLNRGWLAVVVVAATVLFNISNVAAAPREGTGCTKSQLVAARELIEHLADMQTWQADFQQQIVADHKTVGVQCGTIYLKRPGYLRWEIKTPFQQIVWFTPTQTISYDPELDQAVIQPLESDLEASHPLYLLSAKESAILDCTVIEVKKEASNKSADRIYTVRPISAENYQSARLQYHEGRLSSIEIVTVDHQLIKLVFNNIKGSPKLSEQLFRFAPKTSTEVLR